MGAGRKKDPRAGYVMHRHKNGDYYYAYTSKPCMDDKGERVYKRIQWGRLDSTLRFQPTIQFSCLPKEEREKFVFPQDWDLSLLEYKESSLAKKLLSQAKEHQSDNSQDKTSDNGQTLETSLTKKDSAIGVEQQSIITENGISQNLQSAASTDSESADSAYDDLDGTDAIILLVGATWLVSEWADKIGLTSDLLQAFDGNKEKVDILMTLVIYALTHHYEFSRVSDEQTFTKFPTSRQLNPAAVTRFFSSITLSEMSRFFSLWGKKFDEELCGFDSTSISSYSHLLCDAKYGYNKDGDDLPQINFIVVYSLTSGVPLYYEEFSGNYPDSRGLAIAIELIEFMGFGNIIIVTDRGYDTIQNIETLAWKGKRLLTAAKTYNSDVKNIIKEIEVVHYYPKGMEWDSTEDIFYKQVRQELVLEQGGEERKVDYRINIFYSREKAFEETKKVFDILKDMENDVRDAIRNHRKVEKDKFSKDNNLLNIKYINDEYVESFTVNEDKLGEKLLLCGFYASKTINLDLSPMAAHTKYQFRDEHEKDFYILKDTLNMSRLRSYTEQSKDGRVFTLFIALIIASSLKRELKNNEVLGTKYHNETDLIGEMKSMKATFLGKELVRYHPLVGMQRAIAESLGLALPEGCGTKYTSIRKNKTGKRGRPRKAKTVSLDS